MPELDANDCRALLAIISNARITGADAALVVQLQQKLQRALERLSDPDPQHADFGNPGGSA